MFSWLPLATVINDRVMVVHGGVSEQVDLDFIQTIDRHKVRLESYLWSEGWGGWGRGWISTSSRPSTGTWSG